MTETLCPNCGQPNDPGHRFCDACGSELNAVQATVMDTPTPSNNLPLPKTELIDLALLKPAVSTLVLLDGTVFEIEMIEGQEEAIGRADLASDWHPAIDLTPHGGEIGGVSRRHATLRVTNAVVWLEDVGSGNGTRLNGRKLPANQPVALKNGDEIEFGRIFCRYKDTQ